MTKNAVYLVRVLVALGLGLMEARADFATAWTDYQSKRFEPAYHEFKRLAELGDIYAQRNLAAMYARGEFVEPNWIEAYAWASVAKQDDEAAQAIFAEANKKLDEVTRPEAMRREQHFVENYSKAAIEAKLFPVCSRGESPCSPELINVAKLVTATTLRYPRNAALAGDQISIVFSFYLDKNGHPKLIVVDNARTDYQLEINENIKKEFISTSIKGISEWIFEVDSNEKIREHKKTTGVNFILGKESIEVDSETGINLRDLGAIKDGFEKLKSRAKSGDAKAQFQLAQEYQGRFRSEIKSKKERQQLIQKLYQQSAINGYGKAQHHLATKILNGDRCEKDDKKGMLWLSMAAQSGDGDAQYALAQRLFRGDAVQQDTEKAIYWLREAAKNGGEQAKLKLAAYELSSGQTDPQSVLALLPDADANDDLHTLEIKAMAYAAAGDYDKALVIQEQVMSIVDELDFVREQRVAMLDSIRNKKPVSMAFSL